MPFKTGASHELNHNDLVIQFGGKKNVELLLHIILGKWLTVSEADSDATTNV